MRDQVLREVNKLSVSQNWWGLTQDLSPSLCSINSIFLPAMLPLGIRKSFA